MVKSLLLACAMSGVYLIAVTVLFRAFTIKKRAGAMTRLFLLTVPVFIAGALLTPADLGFLPESLAEPIPWVDLGFGLLLYFAGFFGGILQLYNLADRGFSLRIVMDIHKTPIGAMTLDEVLAGYSAGKGIGWMYQKRLDGLLEHQLIAMDRDWVMNSNKGRRAAAVFGWLRRFLQMDQLASREHKRPEISSAAQCREK